MKAEYIDHMGTDLTVVNAARVSFDKHHDIFWEEDEGLIKYLARHNHWTPFSHCQITLRETVPIFVARQRFKHVVGFTYNEVSRRYVDDVPEFYYPKYFRSKANNVKQGSQDIPVEVPLHPYSDYGGNGPINLSYNEVMDICEEYYSYLLKCGVAPEQARMVLPQSMYTSYYVTGSLAAWARAYNLRSDPHAQKEIQDLAKQWNDIIHPLFPVSWKALCG